MHREMMRAEDITEQGFYWRVLAGCEDEIVRIQHSWVHQEIQVSRFDYAGERPLEKFAQYDTAEYIGPIARK